MTLEHLTHGRLRPVRVRSRQEVRDLLSVGVSHGDGRVGCRRVSRLGRLHYFDGGAYVRLQQVGQGSAGIFAVERLYGVTDIHLVVHQPLRRGLERRRLRRERSNRGKRPLHMLRPQFSHGVVERERAGAAYDRAGISRMIVVSKGMRGAERKKEDGDRYGRDG